MEAHVLTASTTTLVSVPMASQAQTVKFQDLNATRIHAKMEVLALTTISDLTLVIVRTDGLVLTASKW